MNRDGESAEVMRFILLSTQRSGTSWMMERFDAHPRIGSYGELLLMNHEGWPTWPPGGQDRPVYKTYLRDLGHDNFRWDRHRYLFRYLDYVFAPRHGYEAIGLKVMYDEVRPLPVLLPYIRSRGVRIIHLIRTNLLDIALSQAAIALRKSSHAWSLEQRENIQVHVDTAELLRTLRRHERQRLLARAILRRLGAPNIELEYEALRDSDSPMQTALRFLNVADLPDTSSLQAKMLKLAPDSHREGIANFGEVQECLRGTRFGRLLRP